MNYREINVTIEYRPGNQSAAGNGHVAIRTVKVFAQDTTRPPTGFTKLCGCGQELYDVLGMTILSSPRTQAPP